MKYIIDIPDEHESDYIAETPFGKRLFFPLRITDVAYSFPTHLHVEEYTELDRKAIEDEVWSFARRIICPSDCCEDSISKYTEKFLGIRIHKAREIFKDLSYQEVKAKYEEWKKQKEDKATMKEVTALAEKIGIHKLYSMVKEIRGE